MSASATISGGTLNNVGGTLGTLAHDSATLDGSTGFGAVTIQGTYTADANSITNLMGTINNQGNIQVLNTGALRLLGDAALQGGGTVTLGGPMRSSRLPRTLSPMLTTPFRAQVASPSKTL